MKSLIVCFLVLIGASLVKADGSMTVNEVCDSLDAWNVGDCLKAAQGHKFDANALTACKALAVYNAGSVIECVQAIADKSYDPNQVKACSNLQTNASGPITDCLGASGQLMPGTPSDMKTKIQSAITALQAGRVDQALSILYGIESTL